MQDNRMIEFFRRKPKADIEAAIDFVLVAALLAFASVWAYREFMTTPPYVDPDRYPVRGIDVSNHNGAIDFDKAAEAGIEFAFIKASEGATFRDKSFHTNYLKAKHARIKTGAYHFFRFDVDGVTQAVNFLGAVGYRKLDLGLAIDVEKHGNPEGIAADSIAKRLSEMVDYLNLMGHRVTFYTNRDGYYDYILQTMPGSPLWICSFAETPINAEWTFWQYDHHGKVAGINGDVDLNAFCGNRQEWENFLSGALWPYESPLSSGKEANAQ